MCNPENRCFASLNMQSRAVAGHVQISHLNSFQYLIHTMINNLILARALFTQMEGIAVLFMNV